MGLCLGECEEETASHISREIMRPISHGDKHVGRRSLPSKVKKKAEEERKQGRHCVVYI